MKNIEKLEKVLTKELIEKNVEIVRNVQKLEIDRELIKGTFGITYSDYIYNLKYLITLNEEGYQPFRIMEVELSIDLADLKHSKDSEEEKELLAILIQEHLEKLEDEIKYQIKQLDYQNSYAREVREKVQNYFDSKNKFKDEFGFKDGNLYVTGSGAKIMNTPYKHEVLETPDGLKLGEPIIKPIPSEKILLGSLILQEKDGKLAVTDKNGSTRFI